MSHTPEPWAAYKDGKREMNNISHFIKSLAGDLIVYGHLSEEDAQRIVSCVNACRGISNADLEIGNSAFITVFNERTEYKARCEELQKQRDDLMAALERLSFAAMCRDNTMGDVCRLIEVKSELASANSQAIKAIAAAKSGQKPIDQCAECRSLQSQPQPTPDQCKACDEAAPAFTEFVAKFTASPKGGCR